MSRYGILALGISSIIHWAAWQFLRPIRKSHRPVEIELIPIEKDKILSQNPKRKQGSQPTKRSGTSNTRNRADLLPDFLSRPTQIRDTSPFARKGIGQGWHQVWGSAGSKPIAELKDHRFYRNVLENLKTFIHYPAAIGAREIQGLVQVRIVYNQNGRCIHSLMTIRGGVQYLRNLVYRGLNKMCAAGLEFTPKEGFKIVDISIDFEILNPGATSKRYNGFFGNIISVHKIFWRMDVQQKALYFAKEKVEQHINGKDPLLLYRGPLH